MIEQLLEYPVTGFAYGWRLERRDGVTIGFTSHDRDVVVDGMLLRASPGMEPTTVVEKLGFEDGGLDVRGALTSDAILRADVDAGRWDGAALSLFLFDWTNVASSVQHLASGNLGAISSTDNQFETEFNGPAAVLDHSVVPITSPTCRASFCDANCGMSMARFTHETRILAVENTVAQLDPISAVGPDAFASGAVRWLEGANAGLRSIILSSSANAVLLAEAPPFPVSSPARAALLEGCNKTAAQCSNRFANMVNFRGEPHLPGNDLLTRYPGAS